MTRIFNILSITAVAVIIAIGVRAAARRDEDGPKQKTTKNTAGRDSIIRLSVAKASEHIRRARISQDHGDYRAAEASLKTALETDPRDVTVQTMLAIVQAGQHRFEDALATTRRAIINNPSIVMNYAIMTDALVELGRYDEAVEIAQKMIDLKPCTASLLRVSYLRSIHGDGEGSIELLNESLNATKDGADRAWVYVHLARESLALGRAAQASQYYQNALAEHPRYRAAELGLAKLYSSSGDVKKSLEILKNLLAENADDPDAHAELAAILLANGEFADAKIHFNKSEELERTEIQGGGKEWHHLVELTMHQPGRERDAVEFAKKEYDTKKDIYTCGRYAKALLNNGQWKEAREAAAQSLRTGSEDPFILAIAGEVFAKNGETERARKMLQIAVERRAALEPLFAKAVEETLAKL